MYTPSQARLRAPCNKPLQQLRFAAPLVGLLAGASFTADAATLVLFDFNDAANALELTPEIIAPGVAAGLFSDTAGTLTSGVGNPGRAVSARTWFDGNAWHFTLEPLPGFTLSLDGFSFDDLASGTGPKDWQLQIDGVSFATGPTAVTAFGTHGGAFALGPTTGPLGIALLGSGASSNSGTWRIDNFALTGAVAPVPVPAAFVLLLSGIAGLVGLRVGAPV